MIHITRDISIAMSEIQWEFIRSSGPGGQNVNKVATAVQLRFDVNNSPSLPDGVRARLIRLAGRRMTAEGFLILDARRFRTQDRNRQDAINRRSDCPQGGRKTQPPPEDTTDHRVKEAPPRD